MYPFLLPKQKWQEQAPKKSQGKEKEDKEEKRSPKETTTQMEVGAFFFLLLIEVGCFSASPTLPTNKGEIVQLYCTPFVCW